jgi:hypothetical protein
VLNLEVPEIVALQSTYPARTDVTVTVVLVLAESPVTVITPVEVLIPTVPPAELEVFHW